MKTNPQLTKQITAKVSAEAERLRDIAGASGAMDDGGAGSLESDLEMWLCGLRGDVPACWETDVQQIRNEQDPEWEEYQRLQKKFSQE